MDKKNDLGQEPKTQGRFSDQRKVESKVPLFNRGVSFVQKMLGRKHECTHAHTHTVTLR